MSEKQSFLIENLKLNEFIKGEFFLISHKEINQKKNGEEYIRFILTDGKREIKAFLWDNINSFPKERGKGSIVKVQGTVREYLGDLRIMIRKIRLAKEDEANLEDFLPKTMVDIASLISFIEEKIESLNSDFIKELLLAFYLNGEFIERIKKAPAAKRLHHNTIGGLLEHTVTVTKTCDFLASLYPYLKRDILIGAALLHDIGKIQEFNTDNLDYTDEGRLIGHLVLGAQLIEHRCNELETKNEQEKLEIIHAVLAHHGSHEWGSPTLPMTVEALALHYADNMDAKITSFINWQENNPDTERKNWSKYWQFMQRFIYHYDSDEGIDDNSND